MKNAISCHVPAFRWRVIAASIAVTVLVSGCASSPGQGPDAQNTVQQQQDQALSTQARLARSALAGGDIDVATNLYQKMLDTDPDSLEALLGMADAAYLMNEYEFAKKWADKATSADTTDIRPPLILARIALKQRHLTEAEERYRGLTRHFPDHAESWSGLGVALDLQGRHKAAQAVYADALSRFPENHGVRINYGLSLVLSGKVRHGANLLLEVASLPNAPPEGRLNLALAYGMLGNENAAKTILRDEMNEGVVEENLRFYALAKEALTKGN